MIVRTGIRRRLAHSVALLAVVMGQAFSALAYDKMSIVGDWKNWNPYPANMSNIGPNLWQGDIYLYPTSSTKMKFVANETWSSTQWGETNQADFIVPITGVAEIVGGYTGDIVVSNLIYGIYRFTFNDATRSYSIDYLSPPPGTNYVRNSSFEQQGTAAERAWYWEWSVPDVHAGTWGHTDRRNWRAHSGSWEGTIEAQWSEWDPDYGGWWQEATASAGQLWEAGGWFWADNSFTASLIQLKIEFYDIGYTQLSFAATNFLDVGETWVYKSLRATAPDDCAWARIVICADHMGRHGALQFDDLLLRPIATREQDFSYWGTFTNDGCWELDDWTLCTGRAVSAFARSGYAASVAPPSAGHTNYIQSPLFNGGIGYITFWYRHGLESTNDEPTNAVAFQVRKSPDGTNWTLIAQVTNITTLNYKPVQIWQSETSPYMVRIEHISGSDRLLIDDITVDEPSALRRVQDFNDWPESGTNYGDHISDGWRVNTGRVSTINAYDGKSLELPPGTLTNFNYILSPTLTDGFGTVSFMFARGSNSESYARLALEASYDGGTTWVSLAVVTNISSTSYSQFNHYYYSPSSAVVRIACLVETSGASTVRIEEHFDGGASPPPGWIFSGITETYSSDANSGESPPAIKFNDGGDQVTTAEFSSPTNLSFWIKSVNTPADSVFQVEYYAGGSWQALTNIAMSNVVSSGETFSLPLSTNATRVRFTYQKNSGQNLSLDDVIVTGSPIPPAAQGLFLDDITINRALVHREQDFDSWPAQSYGESTNDGWWVSDVCIDDDAVFDGQAARIRSNGAFIQTPFLPGGIGTIRFLYRRYSTSGADPVYELDVSTNGENWTAITNLTISSTNASEFELYRYDPVNTYVRLIRISGDSQSSIAVFDEFSIDQPSSPADVVLNAWNDPDAPWTNDAVDIWATAITRYGAKITNLTAYYRLGTSGAFSAIAMVPTQTVHYITASPISAQPPGTRVEYYVRCDFLGPGSESTSPRYYPEGGSNSPAWYAVPRAHPGQVWINELNYVNEGNFGLDDTNEFVELCGPAGFDLSGWTVELAVLTAGQYKVYASYTITNGATLGGQQTNGYGFFVLGDVELPESDMTFSHTNDFDWSQISDGDYASGIRIINEAGGIEQALSYRGDISGFSRIPAEEDMVNNPDPADLQLGGSGTNYGDFSWVTNDMTPGAVNAGQTLQGSTGAPPPEVVIVGFALGTNVTIWSTGTNDWTPQPFYTTNLRDGNSWLAVSPYNSSYNSGTNTVWFDYPATSGACLFRIRCTQP